MKVVHLTAPDTITVSNFPVRCEFGPCELLLEPTLVGLTGSDLLRYRLGPPIQNGFRQPHIPGGEFVARVAACGRGTANRGLLGKRVVGNPVSPCMKCEWCLEGNRHQCPNVRVLGWPPVNGALRQRFAWPADLCIEVPDSIPDELAVLVAPISLALSIVDNAQATIMGRVAVIGAGQLGLMLIRILRATGAGEILSVDPNGYRRDLAMEHGATAALDPYDAPAFIRSWPRRGADVSIDVTNASEGSREAVAATRVGGRVIIAGIPRDNRILFNARDARQKELTLRFVRRPYKPLDRALRFLQLGALAGIEKLITHRFPMDQAAEAYEVMRFQREGAIKAVLEMPPYSPSEESPARVYTPGPDPAPES